jgi:hypothetical protein
MSNATCMREDGARGSWPVINSRVRGEHGNGGVLFVYNFLWFY